MHSCKTENLLLTRREWTNFIKDEYTVIVKIWTLAGISPIAWRDLLQLIGNLDSEVLKPAFEELYHVERCKLNQLSWLKTSKLQEYIDPARGKLMTADVQVTRFFVEDDLNPQFEINAYLGSEVEDPDSDTEVQDLQEVDSMDSGWGFYSSERVRDLGEDF